MKFFTIETEFTDGSKSRMEGNTEMDVLSIVAGTLHNCDFTTISILEDKS